MILAFVYECFVCFYCQLSVIVVLILCAPIDVNPKMLFMIYRLGVLCQNFNKKFPNVKVGGGTPICPIALAPVEDHGDKDAYFVHINPTPTTLVFFNIVLGT